MHFRKITIIGIGLLGGSIGLAVRRGKLARQTAGFVRRRASLKDCERAGAVDFATTDLLAAVWDADLVILCLPLSQMRSRVREMLPALKRGAIVTDVGSVKAGVVRELESLVAKAGAHFVGSHPMAGAEKTGVSAGPRGFVRQHRLRRDPDEKDQPGGAEKGGAILERDRFARAAIDAGNPRRTGEPVQPFAARRRGGLGQLCFESGASEAAGRTLCERFSRHDTHRVRLARNVARHRPGQSQKPGEVAGCFHCRFAESSTPGEKRRREVAGEVF